MAVEILKDLCKTGDTQMTVVVQAGRPDEITSPQTRRDVIAYARSVGFPANGVGGLPQSYPVDDKGETSDGLVSGQTRVAGYRGDFLLQASY